MEARIYKNGISYISSSGPGVYRKVIIPDLNIEIDDCNNINKALYPDSINNKTNEVIFKYPYESITLPEEYVNDLKKNKRN